MDLSEKRHQDAEKAAKAGLKALKAGNYVEASKHFGAAQRRTRLLGGLGRGG